MDIYAYMYICIYMYTNISRGLPPERLYICSIYTYIYKHIYMCIGTFRAVCLHLLWASTAWPWGDVPKISIRKSALQMNKIHSGKHSRHAPALGLLGSISRRGDTPRISIRIHYRYIKYQRKKERNIHHRQTVMSRTCFHDSISKASGRPRISIRKNPS